MKKITLLLVGILFMLLANGQSQVLHLKLKSQQGSKSKNPSVELVKNQIDKCLRNQQAQANRKSAGAELPTLDSILTENNQFEDTEYGASRFKYDANGLNTYYMDDWYAPAFDDIHYYNIENYFYNENGLEDKRTYLFGANELELEEYKNVTFSYNNEQLIDSIIYNEIDNGLTTSTIGVIEYNESNQVSSTVIWSEDGNEKLLQEDFYYNSSTSLLEQIKTFENVGGDNLLKTLSTSFGYNNGIRSQVTETTYNDDGSLRSLWKEFLTFNDLNIPTEWYLSTLFYNEPIHQEFKEVLTYENDDEVVSPIMFKEQLTLNILDFGRLSKINMFEKREGEWQDVGFGNFYYSDSIYYVTSIPTTPKISSLNVYPNPANNLISIDIQTDEPCDVNFYDVSGKLVMQTLHATQNIDITSLKAGYYLVQVHSNGTVLGSSKLLKN